MNIDELIKLLNTLSAMGGNTVTPPPALDNGMIGQYVLVRCRDAGVHAGWLESHNGRECVLTKSRRLWYWKCAENKCFLSGVAAYGLDKSSKLGCELERIHLTEDCEIIQVSEKARKSIQALPDFDQE